MLQQFRIEKWLIEADIDKTREFYSKDIPVCNCLYCKNYVEACKKLRLSVSIVFTKLGINPAKPAHLSEFPAEEARTRLYLGHYHLVGRVLQGELCTDTNFNEKNTIEIDNFTVGFSDNLEFVPEGFPNHVLQLSFDASIPWVLKENPDD
ncbi:hypothetical protein [Neobacillus sp. SuZ13]|uniref:hypothetical protein n=1 Tax=Neobacillus sp. SuZ13 TaxID=3047875 RepID=UPI0024BFF37B|nr:hypothetical protein [Neobacillus sp. SuZ13]WHY69617.1 hypothetical protein QNH17_13695 [Neobacillus sp. SuZ13]